MRKRSFLLIILLCGAWLTCLAESPKREMRMVWIATVNNIDWSPKNTTEPYKQREAMIAMLDTFQSLNINSIIFQIRPTADALYESKVETWSRFLTGEQGVEPYPYYDPLAFTIEEAHRRNIDVHVWINPYRLLNSNDLNLLDQNNLFFKDPELFIKYGEQYIFNPARQETLDHLQKVISDIVSRYDIDALHIDDYFYPYPIAGKEFPDKEDFKRDPRGFKDIKDWRRDNVNRAIKMISETVREIKPHVEFGVSPFGVWRNATKDPRGSNTKALSNYDDLYADILHWIKQGQVDYIIPQLYWEFGHKTAEYKTLAEWWSKNSKGTNLYVGLYASNLGNSKASKAWTDGNELCRQMTLNRTIPKIEGVGLYSAVAIMENRLGIADSLRNNYFRYKSLVPVSLRTTGEKPEAPENLHMEFDYKKQRITLNWQDVASDETKYYVVYFAEEGQKIDQNSSRAILGTTRDKCLDITTLLLKNISKRYTFAVTAVNRYNEESRLSRRK